MVRMIRQDTRLVDFRANSFDAWLAVNLHELPYWSDTCLGQVHIIWLCITAVCKKVGGPRFGRL